MKPVCLVIGAGAGIGGNVARRFAQEGYHACVCRRTDETGLKKLVGLKKLKKLYLWQTKVTPAGVEEFKKSVPGCDVNLGISVQ